MTNYKMKFVKSAAAIALGASVITSAVVAGDLSASAKTTYKVSKGKLVNAKTKKAIKGYKTYKSVLYKDGKKYTGTYKAKYYKSGKLFTGLVGKTYYKKGVKATGTYKGVYYKKGKAFTGTTSYGNYYKNGVRFTGKTAAGTYYKNGKKFNGTTAAGYYYINGKRAEGIILVKDVEVEYKNGKVVADKTAPVITIDGQKDGDKIELKNGADFATPKASVKDNVDSKVKVVTEIKDQDGKVVKSIDTKVAGTYTITYAAKDASDNASVATITVVVGEADLAVESVSAITSKSVKVTFNKEVTSVKDVAIADASGNKLYVKDTKLAEDKKSATVTLYDTLKSGSKYDVTVKADDIEVKGSLDFVVGEAKSVELADQTVAQNGTVSYKVLDANGLDITADTKVSIETDKTGSFTLNADGTSITSNLTGTNSAFLKVIVKDANGKVLAESSRVTISAKAAAVATKFGTAWTVGTDTNFAGTEYKPETSVALNADKTLTASLVDQYGEATTTLSGATVKYSSLDTSVAIIDAVTGKITPRKEGKAAFKVELVKDDKVIDSKVVEVTVTAAAKFTSIAPEKDAVNVTVNGKDGEVTFKTLDQFGNETAVASDIKKEVTSADTNVATATLNGNKVVIKAVKAGTTTVTVKYGDVTKTINVTVAEVGAIVDYSLEGFVADLKTKDDATTENINDTEMAVEVYGKDANGTLATGASNFTYTVTDKATGTVKIDGTSATTNKATIKAGDLEAGKTYTLTAKVGSLTVATKEFTVTENGVLPAYKITTDKYTAFGSEKVSDALAKVFEFTNDKLNVTITGVEYTSDNTSVIENKGTDDDETKLLDKAAKKDGTANLYVSKIYVTVTSKTDGGSPAKNLVTDQKQLGDFVISLDTKVAFTQDNALTDVTAGTATVDQYNYLADAKDVASSVTADEVKVLNKFFATSQEATTGGTKLTVDKTAVKDQVTALKAATAVTIDSATHTDPAYVKYAPASAAAWNFSANDTTGAKAIVDGDKAWYNNGAETTPEGQSWTDVGTLKGGITNADDTNSQAYNIKKTAATADKVVYVLGTDTKWYKVTLKAAN